MTFSPGKRARGSSATPRTLFMSGLLGFAGTMHFIRPKTFDSIVPPSLGNRRAWTYASGVAEIGRAALLAVPATRRIGGRGDGGTHGRCVPGQHLHRGQTLEVTEGPRVRAGQAALQIPLVQMSWAIAQGADSRA